MSRKRARPLRALLRADRRMLGRHGITALYLLFMLLYTAALRFLIPPERRALFTALFLLTDPATLSLFFMGAVVLYEKNQRVHAALYVAGVKARAYALSKCAVMGGLTVFVGCFIAWFSDPGVLRFANGALEWRALLNGDVRALCVTAVCMLLGGVLFTCLSLVPASLVKSLNGMLTACGLMELLFLLPAVIELFSPLPEHAGFHPTVLLARALLHPERFAVWPWSQTALMEAAALMAWLLLAALLARAGAARLLCGKGGDAG